MPTLPSTPALIGSIFTKFDTIFQTQYQEVPSQYEPITLTVQSDGTSSIYPWLEKNPGIHKLVGERKINISQIKGYQIYNEPYERTDALKRLDAMTDKLGVYEMRTRDMAKVAKQFPDLMVFGDLLPNGFYTTKQAGYVTNGDACTCYDGKAFFAADHTRAGVTINNLMNTALSEAEFEKAVIQLYQNVGTVGTAGEAPIMAAPKLTLIVGPKQMQTAKRITKAEFGNFGSTNVNYNFVDMIVSPIITDNSWFLVASDSTLAPFIWQVLENFTFTSLVAADDLNVFLTQTYLYGVLGYFGWGYTLPELAIGSTGAN